MSGIHPRLLTNCGTRAWRTRTETELAVLKYINWFNAARLHGERQRTPPREYEQAHYRQHHPDLVRARNHT